MAQNKESACNGGDTGDESLTPGSGRSPGGGNGNPLQHSCLKNTMGIEALWPTQSKGLQGPGHVWVTEHTHRGKENTPPVEHIPRSHAHISWAKQVMWLPKVKVATEGHVTRKEDRDRRAEISADRLNDHQIHGTILNATDYETSKILTVNWDANFLSYAIRLREKKHD